MRSGIAVLHTLLTIPDQHMQACTHHRRIGSDRGTFPRDNTKYIRLCHINYMCISGGINQPKFPLHPLSGLYHFKTGGTGVY